MLLALTRSATTKLTEVGFLLLVIAGIWLVSSELSLFRGSKVRMIVAGIALSAAGVLLIIAVHWGSGGL